MRTYTFHDHHDLFNQLMPKNNVHLFIQLMTKILKRKIHPEGKNEKKANQMKPGCENGADERVSLL